MVRLRASPKHALPVTRCARLDALGSGTSDPVVGHPNADCRSPDKSKHASAAEARLAWPAPRCSCCTTSCLDTAVSFPLTPHNCAFPSPAAAHSSTRHAHTPTHAHARPHTRPHTRPHARTAPQIGRVLGHRRPWWHPTPATSVRYVVLRTWHLPGPCLKPRTHNGFFMH